VKPTPEELLSINPDSPADCEYAVGLAERLDEHFGDGGSHHYQSMYRLVCLLGSAHAAVRHLTQSLPDWQPDDIGALRLYWALARRAEREIAANN
jgi:hypothetical protein